MDENYESSTSSKPNALETGLSVAALAAFIGSGWIGGAAALPLLILGGFCLAGSVVAGICRKPEDECWPCPDVETSTTVKESPTIVAGRSATPEPGRWAERIRSTGEASSERGR